MSHNLDDLRKTAESEPTHKWGAWDYEEADGDGHAVFILDGGPGTSYVAEKITQGADDGESTAKFIATFNPATVLALLTRLEQAERDLVVVRGSQKKLAKQLVATRSDQGKSEWRADNAGQAVARVRESWNEYKSKLGAQIPEHYRRNIDGALTGHWMTAGGTPTGELADVCSCGKSYWPCDALDGDGRG